MATEEEIQSIVLQVINRKDLDDTNKALADEIKTLQVLNQQFRDGKISADQFGVSATNVAQAIAGQRAEITRLEASLDTLEEAGGGFKMRGGMRADLILSHAFRELTSDTATLTEKIERLGMITPYVAGMFGASGAWLMGITLGITAVAELGAKWKEFMAWLGDPSLLEAANKLEELTDKAKKASDEFKKLAETPVNEEAEITGVYKKMATGPQAKVLQDQIIAAMAATGTGETAQPVGQRGGEKAPPGSLMRGLWEQAQAAEAERVRQANIARAQQIISDTHAGKTLEDREGARMRLRGLVGAQPQLFGKGGEGERFGADLEALTPEGLARDAAASDAAQEEIDASNEAWRKKKHDHAKARQIGKQLTQQGEHFQEAGEHDVAQQQKADERARDQRIKDFQREEKARPLEQATERLADFNARQGSPLSDVEVGRAADAALRMGGALGNIDNALKFQFARFIQNNEVAVAKAEQLAAWLNQQQVGPDQSGRFSQLGQMGN